MISDLLCQSRLTFSAHNDIIIKNMLFHPASFEGNSPIIMDKKKFLNELGKLLTFMFDEDRRTALAMYEDLFREADDEDALLQLLSSPTRQAVTIARAYDAKERQLAMESRTGRHSADSPDFIRVIEDIRETAIQRGIVGFHPSADQFSLFDEEPEGDTLFTAEEIHQEPAPAAEPEDPFALDDFPDELKDFIAATVSMDDDAFRTPDPEKPARAAAIEELTPEEKADQQLDLFTLEEDLPAEKPVAKPRKEASPAEEEIPHRKAASHSRFDPAPEAPVKRKCSIPMLILYLLISVPITAFLILLLLIPTLLCLAASVATGVVAVQAIASAFVGFAVFADIMVVLGGGLMTLALALLFLWLFIWLVNSVIAGLIQSAIRLGNRLCYREAKNS